MIKILISGSSGFIGKNLINFIEKKPNLEIHKIQNSSISRNKNSKIFSHTLPNKNSDLNKLILDINPDIFIHLAWKGIPDYSLENSVDSVKNTIDLANSCLLAGTKKIIATGSCWEYLNPIGKINEAWPLDNNNFFKASKNYCNRMLEIMCKEYKANLIWLRLFYVYGKFQHENSLLPFLINQGKKGIEPIANNPYCLLDFINAYDVSQIIYKLIFLNDFKGSLNVGSGETFLTGDIVNKIRSKFGYEKIIYDKKEEIKLNFCADLQKLNSLINFKTSNIMNDVDKLI